MHIGVPAKEQKGRLRRCVYLCRAQRQRQKSSDDPLMRGAQQFYMPEPVVDGRVACDINIRIVAAILEQDQVAKEVCLENTRHSFPKRHQLGVILGHHFVHVVVGIKAVLVSRVFLLP